MSLTGCNQPFQISNAAQSIQAVYSDWCETIMPYWHGWLPCVQKQLTLCTRLLSYVKTICRFLHRVSTGCMFVWVFVFHLHKKNCLPQQAVKKAVTLQQVLYTWKVAPKFSNVNVDLAQQITRAHRSPVVGHRSGHTCANRRQLDHAWIHYTTSIEDFIFLNANKHLQGKYEGFRCGRNIKGLNALQISAQSVLNSGLVLI